MGIHARHDPYRHYNDETRRHYKKDSQFLADLYTITYINHSDDGETHRTTVDAKRRNDREEIRRRLAMGIDDSDEEDVEETESGRKPRTSRLHSRIQNGMNLQICFMNETATDSFDGQKEAAGDKLRRDLLKNNSCLNKTGDMAPYYSSLPVTSNSLSQLDSQQQTHIEMDFFTQQSKLQIEARTALAQAKELARVQMQVERQQRKHTRISDLVRQSLEKLGIPFPWDCRRLNRQILTELNIAQLQVIVNDLHTQIEGLNEELVNMLLKRDDGHMEQDSMLVDIEDLTRYLTAKQATLVTSNSTGPTSLPVSAPSTTQRLRSLAHIPILRK